MYHNRNFSSSSHQCPSCFQPLAASSLKFYHLGDADFLLWPFWDHLIILVSAYASKMGTYEKEERFLPNEKNMVDKHFIILLFFFFLCQWKGPSDIANTTWKY